MPNPTPSTDQLLHLSKSAMVWIGNGVYIESLARDLSMRSHPAWPIPRIKGRNVAMVTSHQEESGNVFREAALELGARVSPIQPSLSEESSSEDIRLTSRLLGRLYSAIEWPGASIDLINQIRKEAAIPIYGGISVRGNPLHTWAIHLDIDGTDDEKWRYVIQAILLRDLG